MLLSEIIAQLQVGEFSQISFGSGAGKLVTDADYKAVMLHVNLGLSALYKRFNIKRDTVVLKLNPKISMYQITSANSVRKGGVSKQYILDADKVFKDDINKIEKVYWRHNQEEIPLNETNNRKGVMTPTLTSLAVPQTILDSLKMVKKDDPSDPDDWENSELVLEYRAGYFPSVKITDIAVPEVTKFDFPDMYTEALLYFIASRVHNPIGLSGNTGFHQGNNYAAKFEAECQRIESSGLQVDYATVHTRFRANGWV